MRELRKKIWIDRFQTYLAFRLAAYFLLYQVALWALFLIDSRMLALSGAVTEGAPGYGFALTPAATIGLGLLFIYDSARLTHRIVGPMYRFRKTIQAVTAGGDVHWVNLRDGDYLQEMKDDLNDMLRALELRGDIVVKGGGAKISQTPATPQQPAAV